MLCGRAGLASIPQRRKCTHVRRNSDRAAIHNRTEIGVFISKSAFSFFDPSEDSLGNISAEEQRRMKYCKPWGGGAESSLAGRRRLKACIKLPVLTHIADDFSGFFSPWTGRKKHINERMTLAKIFCLTDEKKMCYWAFDHKHALLRQLVLPQ